VPMSLATACPQSPPARGALDTRVLVGMIWLATVVAYLAASFGQGGDLSTDDAMRLVQVRDLLAGQRWFDLTQHRLSPPEGLTMHWSRLIDLPLAAMIALGKTVLPAAIAERVAMAIWPAGLLLLFFAGIVRLGRALAGDSAARLALIFAALMAPVLQHFRPGAIDHHNVQLVLLVWSLVFAISPRPRDAAIAALLSAFSLAIGVEMAPAVAALAGAIALRWIVCGDAARQSAVAFGLAFAAVMIALFAATVPPRLYTVTACDALSNVYVVAAAAGGLGLAALASLRAAASSSWTRLAGAGALAALLGAMLVVAFPACLGDPYAHLDPRLTALWMNNVSEARNVFSVIRDLPHELLAYYGLTVAGLALGGMRCLRERDGARWSWIVCGAVLAALFAVAPWQMRGAAAADAVAAALVPAALVRMFPAPAGREVYFGLGRAALIAAFLVNPLALIAVGNAAAGATEAATGTRRPVVIADGPGTCRLASDYAPLAQLPKGLVLGFIDAGPFILMETPHSVLAAPYHRNIAGNAAMFDVFLGAPSEAAARLAARSVTYLAFCPGAPERHNYAAAAPEGLAAVLARGETPAFLERIPLAGTALEVYRVRHGA
jgi:hypothetical protein